MVRMVIFYSFVEYLYIVTDEPGLHHVVILDPVRFFVNPVSNIICHHLQELPIHKKCRKENLEQWHSMVKRGVIEHKLLVLLLSDHKSDYITIVRLMMKFGFLVELENRGGSVEYLLPALLPHSIERTEGYCWSEVEWSTCHFVFTTKKRLGIDKSIIEKNDLDEFGYLPDGLFERLIGKAVNWAETSRQPDSIENIVLDLSRTEAILKFGAKRFRLKLRSELCTIEVNFEGRAVKAVHKKLMGLIQEILDDCMKSVYFFTTLPYPYRRFDRSCPSFDLVNENQLVSLPRLQSAVDGQSFLMDKQNQQLLSVERVSEIFEGWLLQSADKINFDIFLSYRQPQPAKNLWQHDSQFVHAGESTSVLIYM